MSSRAISRKQSADALRMVRTWRFPVARLFHGGYAYSIGTTRYVLTTGPRRPVFGPAGILTTI
jgi:hypothetical protein